MDEEEKQEGLGNQLEDVEQQLKMERGEIEEVYWDGDVLDQGCVRFDNHLYVATLHFRRIHCNYENMLEVFRVRNNVTEL